jgi:hypothetical protein
MSVLSYNQAGLSRIHNPVQRFLAGAPTMLPPARPRKECPKYGNGIVLKGAVLVSWIHLK